MLNTQASTLPPSSFLRETLKMTRRCLSILAVVVGIAAMLWCFVGLVVLEVLAYQVPLQPEDFAKMSWLGSPSTALHFSTGAFPVLLGVLLVISGLSMAIATNNPFPVAVSGILCIVIGVGMGEGALVRIGILDNVVKIGCFVPDTQECQGMLGLPNTSAVHMYTRSTDLSKASTYSEEYAKQRQVLVSASQERLAGLHSVPGYAILRAPVYLGHSADLLEKVAAQRAALVALTHTPR